MSRKAFLTVAVVVVATLFAGAAALEWRDRAERKAAACTPEENAALHALNMASAAKAAADNAATDSPAEPVAPE